MVGSAAGSAPAAADAAAAGYCGSGRPIQASYKGRSRSIHDGGGLCSPGRWPIASRRFPQSDSFARVRECVRRSFLDWIALLDSQASCAGGAQGLFWQLAAGRCSSSPFDGRHLRQARQELDDVLRDCGVQPERCSGDRRTEVNFRRLAAMLEVAEDPDFEFLREFASVDSTLGVDVLMPRTPAVFEEKTRWNLPEAEGSFEPTFCENYRSATENMEDVRRQVAEGLQRGAVVALSKEEALRKYGGQLAVAALSAVPKEAGSSAVRIIHDATHHVEVNPRIRVRDRLRSPMIDDLEGVLRQLRDDCKRRVWRQV